MPSPLPDPSLVVGGSADAFGALVDPHRRELLVHCYRMLGSIDDAEDAVQDALARAWQGRGTFQRSISFRAWLYRIATNACLDAIERRKRRAGREEHLGVGPIPDDLLGSGGATAGPEARYDARESISLAFLTALQVLPPRQRAVLILRDVLSWHAAEVATLLELSVPAVNSALQRARATLAARYGNAPQLAGRPTDVGHLRALLERYVRAWEAADVAALVALLRDDAVLAMPPAPAVTGSAAIGAFLARTVLSGAGRRRLVPTSANGVPAVVVLTSPGDGDPFTAYTVLLLGLDSDGVGRIDAFFDPPTVARFGALVA